MTKTISEFVLDGYGSGEVEFLIRLSQADSATEAEFLTNILQPLVDVLATFDQTAVLTITGHSDRVDTEGLSREQRRQMELDASDQRAISARNDIQLMVVQSLPDLAGVDFDTLQQFHFADRPAGAAVLRELDTFLTEAQRKQNRRVQLRLIRYQP